MGRLIRDALFAESGDPNTDMSWYNVWAGWASGVSLSLRLPQLGPETDLGKGQRGHVGNE